MNQEQMARQAVGWHVNIRAAYEMVGVWLLVFSVIHPVWSKSGPECQSELPVQLADGAATRTCAEQRSAHYHTIIIILLWFCW